MKSGGIVDAEAKIKYRLEVIREEQGDWACRVQIPTSSISSSE